MYQRRESAARLLDTAAFRQHYAKDFAARARDTTAKRRTAVLLATKRPETMPQLALGGYRRYWLASRTARNALLACTCRRAGALAALREKAAAGRRAASLAELRP
jgi:hypothetical protein